MRPCDNCKVGCVALPKELQPFGAEYVVDGIFVKEMRIPKAKTLVPQHSHVYDHMTLLVKGSVIVTYQGSERHYSAPDCIKIKANTKHAFESLEDDTILYCIHNLLHTGKVEIAEEHQIVGV